LNQYIKTVNSAAMNKTLLYKQYMLIVLYFLFFYSEAAAQNNKLDFYIQQALSNSPLLKDYQNQISSNTFDSLLVRATYKPHVNALTNNGYAPIINGYGYDQSITNGGWASALLQYNQAFVSKKSSSAQLQSIELITESLKNSINLSEQYLKKSVIAQYITAYGDFTQYNLNKEIVDVMKKEESILKGLTEKGIYRQTDYLTFFVSLQQQELLLQQLLIQYRYDTGTLNYLCGIVDTVTVSLSEPILKIERLPAIENSSFFKQFTIDSFKFANQKRLVDANYRPRLNLFADAGYNSTFLQTPYKNVGTSLGFNITVPLYDGKQRKLQYSKVDIADKTRKVYKDFFTNRYTQQISQLMEQLNSTSALIAQINTQLKYSESLIAANRTLLQTGDTRIADYLIAITNYLNVKNQLTLNTINRLQLINQINYWNR
jgi:outer membrane protein TolC